MTIYGIIIYIIKKTKQNKTKKKEQPIKKINKIK